MKKERVEIEGKAIISLLVPILTTYQVPLGFQKADGTAVNLLPSLNDSFDKIFLTTEMHPLKTHLLR